ncbi:hypothetical protein LSTR_LSTR005483 [Laodelphax striatellus]|uniref:Peptidase S1 domain-containing protein n=1 Tax=Laodelphax striatellus TaxID=195883 RepID=A0A482WXT3_LAOST|nr:hypothetical protein LSTR_LSTR005483 [Laodelphax striatellus]
MSSHPSMFYAAIIGFSAYLLFFALPPVSAADVQKGRQMGYDIEMLEDEDLVNAWCQFCYCGLANKMTRIVGGWATEINAYPWMVGLAVKGRLFCGGTLISDLHVITAAHCVVNISPDKLYILISEHNVATRDELTAEVRRVAKVTIHPHYGNTVKYNNDMAIIKLDARVMFRSAAQPACLPPKDLELEGSTAKVVGWGAIKEGGPAATELMETAVTVFSDEECKKIPQFPVKGITSNMFCAGHKGGGHDSCQGDSGGPILVTDSRGRYIIAGIVSWGVGCARPNKPGIYTKVANYIDWISNVTSEGCFCF